MEVEGLSPQTRANSRHDNEPSSLNFGEASWNQSQQSGQNWQSRCPHWTGGSRRAPQHLCLSYESPLAAPGNRKSSAKAHARKAWADRRGARPRIVEKQLSAARSHQQRVAKVTCKSAHCIKSLGASCSRSGTCCANAQNTSEAPKLQLPNDIPRAAYGPGNTCGCHLAQCRLGVGKGAYPVQCKTKPISAKACISKQVAGLGGTSCILRCEWGVSTVSTCFAFRA